MKEEKMFKLHRPIALFALMALIICSLTATRSAQQPTASGSQNPSQTPTTQSQQQNQPQKNQDAVVRISTQLVQVDAVVTDKKGNHVEDLTADDFEMFVDGKKQDLTHFKHISLPPIKRELPPVKKSNAPPASPNM